MAYFNPANAYSGYSGAGAQGAQGAQGATGLNGTNGAQGSKGSTGAQGATGAQGITANQTLNTNSYVNFAGVNTNPGGLGIASTGYGIDGSGNVSGYGVYIGAAGITNAGGLTQNNISLFTNTAYFGTGSGAGIHITLASSGDVTAVSYTTTSSKRYKTNIRPLTTTIGNALTVTEQLSGVMYDSSYDVSDTNNIGLIAEDVKLVLPQVVSTSATSAGEVCVGIDYTRLTALLIEAVKELKAEVNTLKQSLSAS